VIEETRRFQARKDKWSKHVFESLGLNFLDCEATSVNYPNTSRKKMFSPKLVSCSTSADRSSNNHGFRDLQEKAQFIHLVLMEPKVDLWKLRALALSEGGLVNGMYTIFFLEDILKSI
jgi:hypothetical protein